MTEMFGEAWSPMSVPDLAPDDDDDDTARFVNQSMCFGDYKHDDELCGSDSQLMILSQLSTFWFHFSYREMIRYIFWVHL